MKCHGVRVTQDGSSFVRCDRDAEAYVTYDGPGGERRVRALCRPCLSDSRLDKPVLLSSEEEFLAAEVMLS